MTPVRLMVADCDMVHMVGSVDTHLHQKCSSRLKVIFLKCFMF